MTPSWCAAGVVAAAVVVAACSSTSTSTSTSTSAARPTPPTTIATTAVAAASVATSPITASTTTASTTTAAPTTPANAGTADASSPGDIPDDQVFIPFTPPAGQLSVDVPEGWARLDSATDSVFSDKFNSVRIQVRPAATAPTPATATATDIPAIVAAGGNVTAPAVRTVTRKSGPVVEITYEADSPVNAVAGKSVRLAVERYSFWRAGTELVVTLSGAVGADNVDPWRRITDSVVWSS